MIDVAVLAGGRSAEHDISLSSAAQVVRHLDRQRFRPHPVFLDRRGQWWTYEAALAPGANVPEGFKLAGMQARRPGSALDWLLEHAGIAVVFPVLHGAFGEDGTVQGLCELHDVPVVGSSTAAAAVAMDKIRTRECLSWWGIPMPRAYVSETRVDVADPEVEAARIAGSVGFPCFLKMDLSGSTTGVLRVERGADIASFLAAGKAIGYRFLAEAEVRGEEISVGVLGNSDGDLLALPPIGIYPRHDGYFTRHAKYTPGASEEVVPPRGLDAKQIAVVQQLAVRCHRALQCDGMSRTDMIVSKDGPMVLEVNTIPGMTRTSLLPQCAQAVGIDFARLLTRLIELALSKRMHPLAGRNSAREAVS
jgi:D-alanine-D-alanine ligase